MATYVYDDFRITLTTRAGGDYDVRAGEAGGAEFAGVFRVPLSDSDLERAVLRASRALSRRPHPLPPLAAPAPVSREVDAASPPAPEFDAARLGAALAEALLSGPIGAAYEDARLESEREGRGLRLSLSLAGAPALLSLPWEFLYRRPRFLASQRRTPLVRVLDTGSLAAPPSIDRTVRILGVVASPKTLTPLDVAAERSRVEQAVAKVKAMGRVELDWLDPASPRRLREALRDGSYHILHYVGHSDFTKEGEGLLYLEGVDGQPVTVDSTALANLLSDQNRLRLVVLNSCEGARTTLTDPYAGVATTLIQLGVPAVVAMQFEISDAAAILFAEELYTNLIGRQDPIDAAVAEARKAIYIEVDEIEWATPVLFMRDPDVELFRFEVPAAPLPPPRPPDTAEQRVPLADLTPKVEPAIVPVPPRRRKVATLIAGGIGVLAAIAGVVFALTRDDDGGTTETTDATTETTADATDPATTVAKAVITVADTAVDTTAIDALQPRAHSGLLALQIMESDFETHLYAFDPATGASAGQPTDRRGVTDTQPAWDPKTNRLAFAREALTNGVGTGIFYVVPGDGDADPGKQVAPLIPWQAGQFERFPAWAADGALYYTATAGCRPAADCIEGLFRATFDAADDGTGFLDALTIATDEPAGGSFIGVTAIAADPKDPTHVVVADSRGLWMVGDDDLPQLIDDTTGLSAVTYTTDGDVIVAATGGPDAVLHLFPNEPTPGDQLVEVPLAPVLGRIATDEVRVISLTVGAGGGRNFLAAMEAKEPFREFGAVEFTVDNDGDVAAVADHNISELTDLGTLQAAAL